MMAAEYGFPESKDGFSWLSLAQGVFNTQKEEWDEDNCGGGLRWQMEPYQSGYTMKNSISNGGFFQLAARLALYTQNDKYADWAQKAWDWSVSSPLVNNKTWNVADSTDISNQCSTQGNNQWSYNYGAYLTGAAYMYNYVGLPLLILLPGPPDANQAQPTTDRESRMEKGRRWSPWESPRSIFPQEDGRREDLL